MMRPRILCGVAVLALLLWGGTVRADDQTPTADEQLAQAVKLFDNGDYEGARELLKGIDVDELSKEDAQLELQRYQALVEEAIKAVASAKDNWAAAEEALKANDAEKAKKLLADIVANKYAPADVKAKAEAKLKEIAPPAVPQPAKPQPAGGGSSLLDKVAEEHALLWQQAVKTYRDAEAKIRRAVIDNNFAEAHRLLDFAKQTIELNRRYAPAATEYEDLREQAKSLEGFVSEKETLHQDEEIRKQIEEVQRRQTEGRDQVRMNKDRAIQQFLQQADELRKDQRLEEAIQVLKQVLAIDPKNDKAVWLKEVFEDMAMANRDRDAVKDRHTESRGLFVEADEAGVPWHEDIIYPKKWPELTAKRLGGAAAEQEPPATREVREKLQRKVPPELRFDAKPFVEVIEDLKKLTGLNIVPDWPAMEAQAIEKEDEVTLSVTNVSYAKMLELILDAVSAGQVELVYTIDNEGIIAVTTKEALGRKVEFHVYDIRDLLISVPTFRGRQINLDNVGQNSQEGGIGGGRYLRGGGAGGGGGNQGGGGMFGGGGGGGEDEGATGEDPLEPIIQLIQAVIDPESWREAGGNVGTIQALHQQLIISQTATAHSEIRDLLEQLRRARTLQIGVEARYITVSRNWVEQIGVDLDVVLNSGNAGYDRTTILDPSTNNPVLVPRQYTRLGFTPGAPGGVGLAMPTQPFPQPYGQPGLVPGTGSMGPHSGSMTPVPLVNNTFDLAAPSDTNVSGTMGSLANTTPAFQVFGSFLDNIQVDFLLRATQVDRRSSDLDAPRLVLFNGQRATFEAFVEQDYIAALTPIIGDNAGAFLPNINTALTGRSLDVQATVSGDRRYVTMTIRTFTRVTGGFRTVFFGGSSTVGSGFVELATQTTQQIRTTVSVPDGGTLLIGGLKLSGERDVDAGVPILSRIPVLKRAFSNTSNVKDDQVLLILIKPTIIIQEEKEAEQFPTLQSMTRS